MCQLMGDYIMGEIFRAICQEGLENHGSTAVCRCGACHPDSAPLAGNKIIQRDTKAGVFEEFAENRVWQPLHDRYDAKREGTVPDRALDVAPELLTAINRTHIADIISGPVGFDRSPRLAVQMLRNKFERSPRDGEHVNDRKGDHDVEDRSNAASIRGVSRPVTLATKQVIRKRICYAERYAKWKQAIE